jgi:DNA topoisomerase-2
MEYARLTHVEHILKRPDTYVGSLAPESSPHWIRERDGFIARTLSVSPGLVKIFDEVLVNAIDQYSMHPKKVSKIEVVTGKDFVFVRNYGVSIPIKKHETEKGADGKPLWIPELIFGHLLTSSNYNDDEQRVTGGRNGYGAKLANVFSSKFNIKVSDGKKIYMQTWTDNMSKVDPPDIVTSPDKISPYVSITFYPDWKRFGGPGDFAKLAEKRTWDAAMWCSKAEVHLNKELIQVQSLEDYAKMHLGDMPMAKMHTDTFEIVVAHSTTGGFQQASWVNGIATTKGGAHVDRVVKAIIDELAKDKRVTVKPAQIKASLFVFVKAVVINPTFSSQTKAECTSKITEALELKPKFVKDILASGVLDDLLALGLAKNEKELKKTDGAKKSRILGIPKLDDANWAGTHKSHECTLIVTEGDSAKTLAVAGLSVVGRNAYGVFPLRGKPRNVRDASVKQLTDNEEFSNLKKILGLQHGKTYTSVRELRYGRLMIMTDADLDGSHIKGLVLNMIHHFWPGLIQLGFVVAMVTPVIKAGKDWFFTEAAYAASGNRSNQVKYYKGLGTSTSVEAREYFKMIDRLTVKFDGDAETDKSMTLAFAKPMADARKEWLVGHMARPPPGVEYGTVKQLTVTDFIHKDLANFSAEDIHRSIPHMMDGLKPSQRKVIYACLKRGLTTDMKVAQLAGYVAEHTAYHHGEASLQGTIVGLAQNFVGSNNLNLLEPSGQFGTRLMGGKDAASSRYIFTRLAPQTRTIFNADDDAVLKYTEEDGQKVEPEWYAPIVPMVLVNGAEGIGTGFSSYVPPYKLEDLVTNIRHALDGKPMVPMVPYFKGFTGVVTKKGEHSWVLSGVVAKEGSAWRITDLPPGKWIQDVKEHLDDLVEKGTVQKYENHSTETQPDFKVWCEAQPDITKTIHTSNMYLITPTGIKKYASPEEILCDYLETRMRVYAKRKAYMLKRMAAECETLSLKAKFVRDVIEGRLVVFRVPREQLEATMAGKGYPKELLNTKTYEYTSEEVTRLNERVAEYREAIRVLEATSVSDLWKQNLRTL